MKSMKQVRDSFVQSAVAVTPTVTVKSLLRLCAYFFAALLLPLAASGQNVWYVDDDAAGSGSGTLGDPFPYIMKGVMASQPGDTVLVRPGTYFEDVDIDMYKGLFLVSDVDGDPETHDISPRETIIHGSGIGSVVVVASGSFWLEGFTIRNGGQSVLDDGGGIYCWGTEPLFVNNILIDNRASHGGGVAFLNSTQARFYNNVVMNNVASTGEGGGIYIEGLSRPYIINNTVIGNEAIGKGGGMYVHGTCMPTVENNIFWQDWSGISDPEICDDSGSLLVRFCDVEGGSIGPQSWFESATCLDQDPLFRASDFHLTIQSPCIDSGFNLSAPGVDWEIDGQDRIMDGDGLSGAVVDMGADEFYRDPSIWKSKTPFPPMYRK